MATEQTSAPIDASGFAASACVRSTCPEEVAARQVTGAAEDEEPVDHEAASVRASVTPPAITPMWLKAWGKLPENSPEEGSICSGSSPRPLARAHNEA